MSRRQYTLTREYVITVDYTFDCDEPDDDENNHTCEGYDDALYDLHEREVYLGDHESDIVDQWVEPS